MESTESSINSPDIKDVFRFHTSFLFFRLISLCLSGNPDFWHNGRFTRTVQPLPGNTFLAQIGADIFVQKDFAI